MTKKLSVILLITILSACQTAITQPLNKTDTEKGVKPISSDNFKNKAIQENDLGLTYTSIANKTGGDWKYNSFDVEKGSDTHYFDSNGALVFNTGNGGVRAGSLDDTPSSFIARSYIELNKTPQKVVGSWNMIDDAKASGKTINDRKTLVNEKKFISEPSSTVQPNNFKTTSPSEVVFYKSQIAGDTSFGPTQTLKFFNDIVLKNTGESTNPNAIFLLTYNGSNWVSKENFTYNFNRYDKNTSINFQFYGSNVEIFTKMGPDPGWNNIKISIFKKDSAGNYDESNPVRVVTPNLFNSTNESTSVKIDKLPFDLYKVKIESQAVSRSTLPESYLYAFEKAIVHPSIELKDLEVTGFNYRTIKNSSAGIVNITIKDSLGNIISSEEVDLYADKPKIATNPSNINNSGLELGKALLINEFIEPYEYKNIFNSLSKHTILIEATGRKNPLSLGTNISYVSLGSPEYIEDTFYGDKLFLSYVKSSIYGKGYIYIDGVKRPEILDLYQTTSPSLSETLIDNIPLKDSSNPNDLEHTFRISTFENFNLDSFTGKQRATFKFRTLRSTKSYLQLRAIKGSDQGMIKLTLTDLQDNVVSEKVIDLYQDIELDKMSKVTAINTDFAIEPTGTATFKDYLLVIEPYYAKNPLSTGYGVNFDEINVYAERPTTATLDQYMYNTFNSGDVICVP
jgi:hypothetical protein